MNRKKKFVSLCLALLLSFYSVAPAYAEAWSQPTDRSPRESSSGEVSMETENLSVNVVPPEAEQAPENTPLPAEGEEPEATTAPQTTAPAEAPDAPETGTVPGQTPSTEGAEEPDASAVPGNTTAPDATPVPETTVTPDATPAPTAAALPENALLAAPAAQPDKPVYEDGVILLYSYEQLGKIGSKEPVMTGDAVEPGSGTQVLDAQGNGVTYAPDATYRLAQDIQLPAGQTWQLPEGFAGRIAPAEMPQEAPVYDAQRQAILVYNPYQLATMAQPDAAEQPVLDGDGRADTFGVGNLIYPSGEENPFLTYDPANRYILSAAFCSDMPDSSTVSPLAEGQDAWGRDFPGQVIKTINGVEYILIGNAEQLQAIGSDDPVYTAIYQHHLLDNSYEMIYGGDADLTKEQNGQKNFVFGDVPDILATLYCVNQSTGEREYITTRSNYEQEHPKYTSDANYIIFRDIDLNDLSNDTTKANWTPLPFSGSMIGAVAEAGKTIWDQESTQIIATGRPVIANARVIQDSALKVNETMGIGFFSTLSNEVNVDNIGVSGGTVRVSNLKLQNISVQTSTSETESGQTLLGALTSSLGWLIGGLTNLLVGALSFGTVRLNLQETLSALLNARAEDPTRFATGAFAGRIQGDVQITDCVVAGVSVFNQNEYTGGFVGYTEGVTQYDGLSHALGVATNALSSILNVIPGLGLGDLITILLENALPLDSLIPTGYKNPVIQNCTVKDFNENQKPIGAKGKNYAGGFVGAQVGTRIIDCSVTSQTPYTVQADSYGGGFVGLARDAEIKGLLTDVGIELVRVTQPQSLLLNCSITAPKVTIQGNSSQGGFAGALANSYAINDTVQASLDVKGTDNVGGFAGIATLGWVSNLGKNDLTDTSLLSAVTDLLKQLLQENPGNANMLLSLVGIQPSAIMGCQMNGTDIQVSGDNYVGGILGRGDGVYITSSSQENLNELPLWKWKTGNPPAVTERTNQVQGLSKVAATGSYAGGIAGFLTGASVGGLLNDTVGLAQFLGFTVAGVQLSGAYTVSAGGDYAGGAFGMAMAGDVSNVTVQEIQEVTARNNAGGFIGLGGPGSLANAGDGGLTINLLGLNNLISISNVLSIIPGVKLTVTDCTVTGGTAFTVRANGGGGSQLADYAAGGFVGRCNSTKMTNCHVSNLTEATAPDEDGYAGGFVGISRNDDLAAVLRPDDESAGIGSLIQVNDLLGAAPVLVPEYTNCTVTYAEKGGVKADVAGGFAGDFQSGKVNNKGRGEGDYYAVYDIDYVIGQTYAGGFAGKVYSGALADAGGGISILDGSGLKISLGDLLTVIQAYVPYVQYAGVQSAENGFTAKAVPTEEGTEESNSVPDAYSGSAGGFAGYASGAQISYCDVNSLRHTTVTPPKELEAEDASDYFDNSQYAVTGERYAGGFVGCMDIGSAASLGKGLSVLGSKINLSDLFSALDVVVTTIEHSHVYGSAGGYSVLASSTDSSGALGYAGGYAGAINGGHIQDSNAHNFEYIIGQIAAGGYVGEMKPGDVAQVLDNGSILQQLVNLDNLVSALQTFVPTIRNSSTDAVPCGGVVRAHAASDQTTQRGMAGGYVGHNVGGNIWGLNTRPWKTASDPYTGPISICKAERIRSVYGEEYAGGYTGFMEAADTASAGGLSLLGGLIKVGNLLDVLSIVYPTQENTAVYGPLANLDMATWKKWVEYVGQYGGYGFELAQTGTVNNQEELDQKLANYIYGFNVVAGRSAKGETLPNPGGDAGGYVGLMRSGTLTNCMAYDVKQVSARSAAGGYAGRMETGGAADFGSVSILGLKLQIDQLLSVAEVFVPAVRNSSVRGYTSGMTVTATGTPAEGDDVGYAGGFVGAAYGAQIQLNDNDLPNTEEEGSVTWVASYKYPAPTASCDVCNLRRVSGRSSVGGYAGLATAASVAKVNTNASSGLLQGILNKVIRTAGDLVDLLPATVTTIHKANVSAADPAWGFVVDGAYTGETTEYAPYAGGFVGQAQAAVIGEKPEKTQAPEEQPGTGEGESSATQNEGALDTSPLVTVTGLRQVDGGLYAGGFIGLGDVRAVAEVSGGGADGTQGTTILDSLLGGLLSNVGELGAIDVADVLRTYVRRGSVTGVAEGYRVQAHDGEAAAETTGTETTNGSETTSGILSEKRYAGAAGGFAGAVLNGTVQYAAASNLANVQARNYTGGFIGHMGKSGVADVDSVSLLDKLASLNAGVADLFGTQVLDSSVTGYASGIVVQAIGGAQPIAGGFAGYGDLGRIKNSTVDSLKKVTSEQVAGGFIGQTDMAYLVSVGADSPLAQALLKIVNELVKALYLDDEHLESINLVKLNLGILKVELLTDGNALKVELLGLPITVALSKKSQDNTQQTDVAIVTIGDSEIRLSCDEKGLTADGQQQLSEAQINLIKGNRTELESCTVTGVANGYDVFGGGATQDADGEHEKGMAGGFVGYNHEGKISHSKMVLCDTVRGTAKKVGPFTGCNDLKSVYWFNTIASIEGEGNTYSIYRPAESTLTKIEVENIEVGNTKIGADAVEETIDGTAYNRYDIRHITDFEGVVDTGKGLAVYDMFRALKDAKETGTNAEGQTVRRELNAYVSDAKAVLMLDADSPDNRPTIVPEPGVMGDPCSKDVDLTIQKIWDDWFNLDKGRPNSVTLNLIQHKYTRDESGVWGLTGTQSEAITLTSSKDQEGFWSAVWRKVLQRPVCEFDDKNKNGTHDEGEEINAYYVYTVEEVDVPADYTVSYDFYDPTDAGDYELTVTNKLTIPLPDTGAGGDILFVVVGVGILLLGLALGKRRTPGRGEP